MRSFGQRSTIRRLMLMISMLAGALAFVIPVLRTWGLREHLLYMGLAKENPDEAAAGILRMNGRIVRDETRTGLPVTSVSLRGVTVTNPGLVHLRALVELECVTVDGADVFDSSFPNLLGLKKLRRLRISNTWITGSGLTHLRGLPKLEDLDLSLNPRLSDASASLLKNLNFLKSLNLSDTGFTETGIRSLQQCMPDTVIVH
jgi:Leucine Rich repeat